MQDNANPSDPAEQGEASRFRDGDPDAARALYRAYGGLVFAVAYKILGDRELAEEATQQTFVQAWRTAGDHLSRELGPWLAMIAKRVAIDILPPLTEATCNVWEVRRAVVGLSANERQVVRLQHLDGLTHAEIAERLGVPIDTVSSRSFQAHRRLASHLGRLREGTDEPDPPGTPEPSGSGEMS